MTSSQDLSKTDTELLTNFWQSYLKGVATAVEKRNQIVHWNAVTENTVENGHLVVTVILIPPNVYDTDADTRKLTIADLAAFKEKCDAYYRCCNMFHLLLKGLEPTSEWLEVFQKEFEYPLPAGHPLLPPPQVT